MPRAKRDRVPADNPESRDPMQGPTPTGRKRAATAKKVRGDREPTDRAQCTAHKRNGDRCNNPPLRGSNVCRMHGGSAPQVKAKANQRLIEMIMPAMRELRRVLDSKTASDADKLKAVNMVLQRTGFNERQQIDIGLREPSPWERLIGSDSTAFRIERGRDAVVDPEDDQPALPGGGGDEDVGEALTAFLEQRERERASTRISNDGHEVVRGDVIGAENQRRSADPFRVEEKERAEFARRVSEHDPERVRPEERPWERYEAEVRRRVEERRR